MRNLIPLLALFVFFTAGCDSGDVMEPEVAKVQVRLELENLPPLQEGFAYQAWVRVGFEYHASQRFNVTETGSFVNGSGQFIQNALTFDVDISDATEVFISVEPKGDSDQSPSDTIVLAGDVSGSSASLSFTHPGAIGLSFDSASGTFMLLNWDLGSSEAETSGLWFMDGSRANPIPGLALPSLPAGWIYEGWIEKDGVFLSTGTFQEMNIPDNEMRYSNTLPPDLPGEDFLLNAPEGVTFPLDPSGATVRVSIEPLPDDNATPYGIIILSGTVPASPSSATPYPLQTAVAAPTGTATLF